MRPRLFTCLVAGLVTLSGASEAIAQQGTAAQPQGAQTSASTTSQAPPSAGPSNSTPPQQLPPPISDHTRAVALARAGNTRDSLLLLEKLLREHPENVGVKRDYCVVLNWDRNYTRSIIVFNSLPPEEPDYVLLAAASSYRNLQKFRQALDLYKSGDQRFPTNDQFKAGELLTMTDAKQPKEALAKADRLLAIQKDSVPVLLAAGYAAMALKRPNDALSYYDQVLLIDPKNRDAIQQRSAIEELQKPHPKSSHHRKSSRK